MLAALARLAAGRRERSGVARLGRKRGGGRLDPRRVAGRAPEGVPPGVDGAEHGLRRRGVPRLRGHGDERDAAAGLPRGPGVRLGRDQLGGGLVRARSRGRDRQAAFAGIVGGGVIAVGSIATAVAYRGADAERFSPLNHFVSELGELAQSELAGMFNLSLIIGGVCFAVFMSGLAASRPGLLRLSAGVVGVLAGIGGAFAGVFPMDHGGAHGIAASTFSTSAGSRSRLPRWISYFVAIHAFRAGMPSSGSSRSSRSSPSSARLRTRAPSVNLSSRRSAQTSGQLRHSSG